MQQSLILENTAYTFDQITTATVENVAQIALAGRSNVGKSSLVNALAGRKSLAKTSATPGKTRSLNFYLVQPHGFYLVDLPGYGYARCSKTERQKWGQLMESYLTSTRELRALAVLLDSRLPPQKLDVQLVEFAQKHDIPLLPIMTKGDKCKQRERADKQKQWAKLLHGTMPIVTSASSGLGLTELWRALRAAAGIVEDD